MRHLPITRHQKGAITQHQVITLLTLHLTIIRLVTIRRRITLLVELILAHIIARAAGTLPQHQAIQHQALRMSVRIITQLQEDHTLIQHLEPRSIYIHLLRREVLIQRLAILTQLLTIKGIPTQLQVEVINRLYTDIQLRDQDIIIQPQTLITIQHQIIRISRLVVTVHHLNLMSHQPVELKILLTERLPTAHRILTQALPTAHHQNLIQLPQSKEQAPVD